METSTKKTARKVAPAAATAAVSQEAKRRPCRTLRIEDCSASIWSRDITVQGETRTFYSVTLERSYKDRDGSWKYTKTFDADSLGRVVSLCQQASEIIRGLEDTARM